MGKLSTSPQKRQRIIDLQHSVESEIEGGGLDAYEPPVFHHFAPGLYARECHLQKDSVVVGKIHKYSHVNTISKGRVRVSTEFDTDIVEYEAPCTFVSLPGTKRAVFALEDTVWTTYHPTDLTDVDQIEAEVIAPSYDEFEIHLCYEQKKQIEEKT